jgi:hypothetical protein
MTMYQYISHSTSNSYVPVCLVFECQIHAHTGEYEFTGCLYLLIFDCICLYVESDIDLHTCPYDLI